MVYNAFHFPADTVVPGQLVSGGRATEQKWSVSIRLISCSSTVYVSLIFEPQLAKFCSAES